MNRNTLSILIAFMMMLGICNFSTLTTYADANIVIGRGVDTPIFTPGQEVRLGIPIENIGSDKIKDVVISLDSSDIKNFPFDMEKMSTTKRIGSITGHGSENIGFYLKVAMNAEEKIYPIKVNMNYKTDTGGAGTASSTIYVKIQDNKQRPSINVNEVHFKGDSVSSGESTTMNLLLRNEGKTSAKNVELQFEGMKADGIRLDGYMNVPKVAEIEPNHVQEVPVKIHADKNLKSGTYELQLIMKYKDKDNNAYEIKKPVYVPVDGAYDQDLDFAFENVAYPTAGVNTSQDFKIAFDLKNLSGKEAKGLKVSVDGGESVLPKTASIKNIQKLGSGESSHLEFTMFAKDDAEAKNYPIKINIEYGLSGNSDEKHNVTQYVGVLVKGDNSKLTPKIIVNNYSYGKEYVQAGETFPLNLALRNTSQSSGVRNVKVSLTSEGETFVPVGSSNSFFINSIGAGKSISKTIKMKPKVDAEQKTYNVTANIEYEDASGKSYKAAEIIGIPVIQKTKFVISDLEIPEEPSFVGSPVGLSVQFYNMGRSTLRNLMIHTEGDFEIKDGTTFIGNIEAGKDDYYDVSVTPKKKGKVKGKIVFEYEDSVGNAYTSEKPFEIDAQEDVPPPLPKDLENMKKDEGSSKKWIYIGGSILVLIIGLVVYRRRKKKSEEVNIDE